MGTNTACQRTHHVTALKHRNDASLTVFCGKFPEFLGTPAEILLIQFEATHIVFVMCIEAGRDEDHLGLEFLQARHPDLTDRIAELLAPRTRSQRHIAHVVGRFVSPAIGVKGMLKNAAHQHPLVAGKTVLRPVAVMHIEIDDGNALQSMHGQRMSRSNGNVVEETEPHWRRLLAMVAGWAHGTEGVLAFAAHHQIDPQTTSAGRPQGGGPGMRIHRGIRVQMYDAGFGRSSLDAFEVRSRVDSQQLLKGRQRCVVINEIGIDPLRYEVIVDGRQTLRTFRVVRAHIMQLTVPVGDEGCCCHLLCSLIFRLSDPRSWLARAVSHYRPISCAASSIRMALPRRFASDMSNTTKNDRHHEFSAAPRPFDSILAQAANTILGKENQIRLALTCLLAGGHLLIEDLPGMGKTTLAHTLARLLGLQFARVQFTSDLLPADITGVSIFDRNTGEFRFMPGPIFAQLVLADEINRATPKTQSALLEAMEENQVTIEGQTRPLPTPFFVIATQNPVHQIGTFPLPESQLDRFLMRIELGYPDRTAERALLAAGSQRGTAERLAPLLHPEALPAVRQQVMAIHVASPLIDYVQALIEASRQMPAFRHGLSPRAGLALLAAARAWAWLAGRDMVVPDDVQAVLPAVARHRLYPSAGGYAREEDITALIRGVAIP